MRIPVGDADPRDFLPALQRVQRQPPSPLGRKVLWTGLALVGCTLAWAWLGKLDIVAVAEGKLVPSTYVKICLLYTSPSPRDRTRSRMPSSA